MNQIRLPVSLVRVAILLLMACFGLGCVSPDRQQWSRFRGPNGSGLGTTSSLPSEFGPTRNLIWKSEVPAGHSSPILSEDFVFLTGYRDDLLLTFCLRRDDGSLVWEQQAPRSREEKLDPRNSPASPSPVTDGERVFVFFADYGVIAYDLAGKLLWSQPLGPFNNVYGMGASPVLVDDLVILVCDQSTDSYIVAMDKANGRVVWKTPRPEAKSGHSTPVVYTTDDGQKQIIVPGSFLLTAYAVATGEKIWWVGGLSFELKSTPVISDGVVFINGYGSPLNQPGAQLDLPSFEEVLSRNDGDGDGHISEDEMPDGPTRAWFGFVDLTGDARLDADDWNYLRAALASLNGMLAIKLGGHGDMTEESVLWQYRRSVPQLPSPLLYNNVLYMVNDGGIVTTFDPASGEVLQKGRLRGAVDKYYASPVAGDGKVFMTSEQGLVSVLKPDGSLEVIVVNDLEEPTYATPAISDGRIYIRTTRTLYSFGHDE